ncbi:hypothetical protein HOY82DRAFT_618491 [Tuber indicum]|nr:hypothetical protein HOY82DRAFT_618491 [Tuber indicum]
MRALLDYVVPTFGWPLTVYMDNGAHFTGSMITTLWKEHGVIDFMSAISHPQWPMVLRETGDFKFEMLASVLMHDQFEFMATHPQKYFLLAKDKGRKLELRWKTPRILERISKSGVSAHVRQLHDPTGITKRYYLDDLLFFVPRTYDYPFAVDALAAMIDVVEYERDAMGDVQVVLDKIHKGMNIGVDVIENRGTSFGGKV